MKPPGPRYSLPLYADPIAHHRGPSPRFYCKGRSQAPSGALRDLPCLLATELVLAVLPPQVEQALQVQIQPLNGWVGRPVPDWCGVPCAIGHMQLVLPVPGVTALSLGVCVRRPTQIQNWMPDYLLLGTEFLNLHRAEIDLRMRGPGWSWSARHQQPWGELRF